MWTTRGDKASQLEETEVRHYATQLGQDPVHWYDEREIENGNKRGKKREGGEGRGGRGRKGREGKEGREMEGKVGKKRRRKEGREGRYDQNCVLCSQANLVLGTGLHSNITAKTTQQVTNTSMT